MVTLSFLQTLRTARGPPSEATPKKPDRETNPGAGHGRELKDGGRAAAALRRRPGRHPANASCERFLRTLLSISSRVMAATTRWPHGGRGPPIRPDGLWPYPVYERIGYRWSDRAASSTGI